MTIVLDEIIIRLKKLTKRLEKIQKAACNNDITLAQARLVFPIYRDSRGYSMQELSELCGVDKAFVSRVVAHLESVGFVEKDREVESNTRNYKIKLTEKGQCFFDERKVLRSPKFDEWRKTVSMEELRTFMRILDKIAGI